MAIEIERKFLVNGDAWRETVTAAKAMRQGYLNDSGRCSIRVRISGECAELNIKAAEIGDRRAEYEYPIPLADAEEMLATLCVYPPLEKTRYWVRHGGFTWEVDVFEGANAGLVVAELELDSPDRDFPRPEWLGREVTDEHAYYNHALAARPYREWERNAG